MSDFVDTNIFVRLLTQDDPEKAARAVDLLQRANRGEIELATSEAVIAQAVYVLASPRLYARSRDEIAAALGAALAGSRIQLDHKEAVLAALRHYASTRLHFVD